MHVKSQSAAQGLTRRARSECNGDKVTERIGEKRKTKCSTPAYRSIEIKVFEDSGATDTDSETTLARIHTAIAYISEIKLYSIQPNI